MGLETIAFKDFSGGWNPNSDPLNGPKNGFLNFDHCDLSPTGALQGFGNLSSLLSGYDATIHTLWSNNIAGTVFNYVTTTTGNTYEQTTSIITGGHPQRTAFAEAFGYNYICSGVKFKKTPGGGAGVVKDLGRVTPGAAPTIGANAAGVLNGTYQWMQVWVSEFVQGYTTFGQASAITALTTLANQNQTLTLADPAAGAADPDATHVYLYRRGGNLDDWYYVGKAAAGASMTYVDNMADSDVIQQSTYTNKYNIFYQVFNQTNVYTPDGPVYAMVGLVYGRMLYFTSHNIYIAKINCPDVYDLRTTIGFCGGGEIFLFARKLGNNTVIIGTSTDLYLITGTFQELSPGVLDITISPLGVPNPPIGISCTVYNHNLIYMTHSGWIMYSPTLGYLQGETNLCAGVTERLYSVGAVNGPNGFTNTIIVQPPSSTGFALGGGYVSTYSCTQFKGKLYVINPLAGGFGTSRLEIYDFVRKYWTYASDLGSTIGYILYTREEGTVLLATGTAVYVLASDSPSLGTFGTNTLDFKTTFTDNGKFAARKDAFGLRIRANTGGQTVTVKVAVDGSSSETTLGTFTTSTLTERFFDLGATGANLGIFKNIQVHLTVAGASAAFIMTDLSLDYDAYPEPLVYYQERKVDLPPELLGKRVRVRTWPIVIDTLGANVNMTPLINGATSGSAPVATINQTGKKTYLYQFTQDITNLVDLGVRFETTTSPPTPFELHQLGNPEIVQVFPIAKQFDQLGPYDLARYGKVVLFRVRLFCDGSGSLPWKLYFQDAIPTGCSGNITVVANVEDNYEIRVPIAAQGQIVRLVLGGTSLGFNFYRYYAALQSNITGNETDLRWVMLPEPANG